MKHVWLCLMVLFLAACNNTEPTISETDPLQPTNNPEGKEIFVKRCASCHRVNVELTGPALKGAEDRWSDKQKLYDFIRNSAAVIEKDEYAYNLWKQFNQTEMPPHEDLSNEQIQLVFDYIRSVSTK